MEFTRIGHGSYILELLMTWWRNDMITFAQQHAHFALGKHIRCQKGLQGIHTVTFSWHLPSIHPRKPKLGWVSSNFIKVWPRYGRFDICYHLFRGFSATSASSNLVVAGNERHLQHTYLWRSWGSCNCFVPNEKSPFFLPFADRMWSPMHRATSFSSTTSRNSSIWRCWATKEGSLFP